MKKGFRLYVAAWAALVAIFNIIVFVTPNEMDGYNKFGGSFWAAYIFIMIAFVGQLICAYIALNSKDAKETFYKIPLITISYSGLVVMMVFGTLCMIIPDLPNWMGIVVGAIIVGFNAMAVVKASAAAEVVGAIDTKVKVQTFFIKSLTVDADTLMASARSEVVKAECKKVYEAIRYSDPMSNDALASVEGQITLKFTELSEAVKADNEAEVEKIAKEVIILVSDRNKKCKILK